MRAKEARRASATVHRDKTVDGNNPQPPPKTLVSNPWRTSSKFHVSAKILPPLACLGE